ncbi:CHAT domain-containing protein [Microbacterium sp. NPDC056569]|uniref:CHAT domain-containing protein n=1 Tax=Microbacterium sp. NPDC056569 TaxID=3345867 RepID=UPI00366C0041
MSSDPRALYQRGVHLADRGRYVDARRVLTSAARAAAAAGDANLQARITGTTAYLLAQQADGVEAERLCREALALPGLSTETVAILEGQLGSIELERGHLDSAAAWLSRSVEGLTDEPVRAANMRMNRSVVNMRRGRLDDASVDLIAAEAAYREAGLPLDADQAVHNRAYVLMLAGDLVAALRLMQRVREPLDEESDVWAAINELDRAEVLRDAGLVGEAERSLASVAQTFARHGVRQDRAEAEYHLARSLLNHNPERAAQVAATAARRFRSIGSDGWAMRAEAIKLRAQLAVGRVDRSGAPVATPRALPRPAVVAEVADALEAHGHRSDAALLRMSELLARLRRGADPRAVVVPRTPRWASLELGLLAHEVRAERARVAGDESGARRYAAGGLELLITSRGAVGSLDLSGSNSMQGLGVITAGLASAMRSGRPALVFEWSERARHLNQQMVPLRPPPDPELAADLAELRVLRVDHGGTDWLSDPRAALLRDRARERQWSRTRGRSLNDRVQLEELREELGVDDVALSYVFDGNRLGVVAVDATSARFLSLDWRRVVAALRGLRADLDMAASVRTGPMAEVVRGSLDERLAALSRLLLDQALGPAGGRSRVLITAPGVLGGLPWTMLPGLAGRAITVAPSASSWVRARRAAARPLTSAGFAAGPRVARGDEEIRAAAEAWRTSARLHDGDATADAVTALASTVDVLHIAAHGRHSADNPLFSGLELVDGTLFGYDIDLMTRPPQVVVLSACEVGRSAVRWGDESIGMTRVWLHAGTACVIAAPVIVADDAACELLAAMHEGLAAGVTPSEALAAASARTGIVAPFQVHGAGF